MDKPYREINLDYYHSLLAEKITNVNINYLYSFSSFSPLDWMLKGGINNYDLALIQSKKKIKRVTLTDLEELRKKINKLFYFEKIKKNYIYLKDTYTNNRMNIYQNDFLEKFYFELLTIFSYIHSSSNDAFFLSPHYRSCLYDLLNNHHELLVYDKFIIKVNKIGQKYRIIEEEIDNISFETFQKNYELKIDILKKENRIIILSDVLNNLTNQYGFTFNSDEILTRFLKQSNLSVSINNFKKSC
jgi:hypothetical protein